MPSWLAHLVPSMDYGVSDGYREEAGRRLVSTVRSLGALSAEASERCRVESLCAILAEAVSHVVVDEWGVRAAVAGAQAALHSGEGLAAARSAAKAAVKSAAKAAVKSTARDAAWAAWAAWAAARSAARDAAWATSYPKVAASDAAWAARAAASGAIDADAAGAAAWDRMTAAVLDIIDAEVLA